MTKAIFFDIFGTLVDWRGSLIKNLRKSRVFDGYDDSFIELLVINWRLEYQPILKTLKASKVSDLKKITSDPNPDMNLYNISYEDAIKNSKPTIVLFSTPALCVSGTCGPILENLKNIKKDYDEFNFLHIEVYKNFINKTLRDLDTLEVTDPVIEWGLPTEPWIFFLDDNGILKSKFEGFISENELIYELNLLKDF